jgi:signal transduction histidine kinase
MRNRQSLTRGLRHTDNSEDIQRFVDLGKLSASLLHEISNPITVALINLEQLNDQKSLKIRSVRHSLENLTRYVDAARKQIRSESETRQFFVDTQMNDVKRLVRPLARRANIQLRFSKVPHLKLCGDPVKFQQISVNLIVNALEAYKGKDIISSERIVSVNIEQNSRYLSIEVLDHGGGIAKDQLPKLFEPFYTTKSGAGLGLGLVIVNRYVTQNFGGYIRVTSGPVSGTRFMVKLPIKVY